MIAKVVETKDSGRIPSVTQKSVCAIAITICIVSADQCGVIETIIIQASRFCSRTAHPTMIKSSSKIHTCGRAGVDGIQRLRTSSSHCHSEAGTDQADPGANARPLGLLACPL